MPPEVANIAAAPGSQGEPGTNGVMPLPGAVDVANVVDAQEDDSDVVRDEHPAAVAGRALDVDVEDLPPYRQPPRSAVRPSHPRGYKPGTRQVDAKTALSAGAPPWWASKDPKVWQDNTERLRAKTSGETKNIIGWADTGLSGGAGR